MFDVMPAMESAATLFRFGVPWFFLMPCSGFKMCCFLCNLVQDRGNSGSQMD